MESHHINMPVILQRTSFLLGYIPAKRDLWFGNRSSRPKVILPEVMLPETGVMLPGIHCHVARNPESYRPKCYRVYKLEKK